MAIAQIADYRAEYGNSFEGGQTDWHNIEAGLVHTHEWTNEGAAALVQLARDYGSFILGHAYALSVALDIEDGDLSF